MSPRVVFDTMLFFQWVARPPERQLPATFQAVEDGRLTLCLGTTLLEEVRDVLSRVELRTRFRHLTDDIVDAFVRRVRTLSTWFPQVPNAFTILLHPKDDHLFDLAITAQAQYLVTWETRLLELRTRYPNDAERLRMLAPELEVVDPAMLARVLAK
ncbi:MAG: putative toxin-antitoxin system toxin component, PIN family [Planctomycetota bacterium]